MTAVLLLAGLALLVGGAELLVRGASRLAAALSIPPLVVYFVFQRFLITGLTMGAVKA